MIIVFVEYFSLRVPNSDFVLCYSLCVNIHNCILLEKQIPKFIIESVNSVVLCVLMNGFVSC